MSEEEAARTWKAIEALNMDVYTLQQALPAECFYFFQIRPLEARARIKETSDRTGELIRRMEVTSKSGSFGCRISGAVQQSVKF